MTGWWGRLPRTDRQAWLRTGAVALAVAVLLGTARAGTPRSGVLVLFVGFVVVATVWVRGQYADSLDGTPWLMPRRVVLGIAVAGAVGWALYAVLGWDGAALSGAILLYFAVGAQVARWRERPRSRRVGGLSVVGLGLLVGAVVTVGLGAALLGRLGDGFGIVPLALLGVGLVALGPVALSLLSEDAITGLTGDGRAVTRRRTVLGLAGAAAVVVLTVVAALWAGSWLVLVAVGVLGLLVVALASSTQADIAAVVGLLALLGVTPLQASVPEALDPAGRSRVLVALGDSYMSGEGASIYYAGTDDGGSNMCRRSPTAWAAMAGQQRPFDGTLFLACSGAGSSNIRTDPDSRPAPAPQPGEPGTQLAQYRALQERTPFTPSLVVLSIGGNDAGFSTIGLMCLAPGDCNDKQDLWLNGLDQVERTLRSTYDEVRAAFPGTPVVVVPYPDPIADGDIRCDQVALSVGEREFITRFLSRLNDRVRRAAADHGFYYLADMQRALAGSHLQLCDPRNDGRPGINFIGLRSVNGIPEQRFNPANWVHNSLHPNERGHAAMLRVFQNWLADASPLRASAPTAGGGPGTGQEVPTGGPPAQCDLFDDSASGCRPQGTTFVAQQVGRLLLTAGGLAGLLLAAVWAAAVAFFGWRRRQPGEDGQETGSGA